MKIYKRYAAVAVVCLVGGLVIAVVIPQAAVGGVMLGFGAGCAWIAAVALPQTDRLLKTWEPNPRKVDDYNRKHGGW